MGGARDSEDALRRVRVLVAAETAGEAQRVQFAIALGLPADAPLASSLAKLQARVLPSVPSLGPLAS